jgi:FkbM family methyltransferase
MSNNRIACWPQNLLETSGSWLYRRATLTWLGRPDLVQQLPVLYRVFARYCTGPWYHRCVAEILLRSIIALQRTFLKNAGTKNAVIVPLRVDERWIFLDLHDPRFLRVPSELADAGRLLRRFLLPGDTFIDVGANHGTFSIMAAELVGPRGRIISIEPQPRLARVVGQSLERCGVPFEVHQLALGQQEGQVKLYKPRATSGAAGLFEGYSAVSRHETIQVPVVPMDRLLAGRTLPGRVFLKLDIEGSELAFLLGAREFLQTARPRLMIEMNPVAMRAAGTSIEVLIDTLIGLGYDRYVTQEEPATARPLEEQVLIGYGDQRDIIVLPRELC